MARGLHRVRRSEQVTGLVPGKREHKQEEVDDLLQLDSAAREQKGLRVKESHLELRIGSGPGASGMKRDEGIK